MPAPDSMPTTALLAPVAIEALQTILEGEDDDLTPRVLVQGEGAYHALVDYEPGEPHDERHVEAARALSTSCDGPVYLISFGEDDQRITKCQGGAVVADLQYDETPDLEKLARGLGLGGMFPRKVPGPRGFMLVEGATVADVASALAAGPAAKTLRLEARGRGVVGWSEEPLDSRPRAVSRKLGALVYYAMQTDRGFAVLVLESGATTGVYEEPRTFFSEGKILVDSILGETTRDGILRAMGVDDSMNPAARA
ncbi:MAG: hypothetical protein U0325_02625 [Polyangiales bacterium]